jgi:hypothetical protein
MTQELFQLALNITEPWFVSDLNFDAQSKRLDVYMDFKKGSTFSYEDIEYKTQIIDEEEVKIKVNSKRFNNLKAYDTKSKAWRHLNFFE